MRNPTTLLLTACVLGACDPASLPETAATTVEYAVEQLATERDPGTLWDLLPPSYQDDARQWCASLGAALPQQEYEKIFAVLRRAGSVIKLKADFLAANIPLQMLLRLIGNVNEDDLAAAFSATGDVLLLFGGSELNTLSGLTELDPGAFLHGTGQRISRSAMRAVRITGRDPVVSAQQATVTTLSETDALTTLQISAEGLTFEMDFQRIQGRWVPTQLPGLCQKLDALVRQSIDALDTRNSAGRVELLDQILLDLDTLAQAERRGKFETLLLAAFAKYKKLLMTD